MHKFTSPNGKLCAFKNPNGLEILKCKTNPVTVFGLMALPALTLHLA